MAWPSHGHLWGENLAAAQAEVAGLGCAIAEEGGESLDFLVQDAKAEAEARAALGAVIGKVRFHRVSVGDIWLRDTAPIFVQGPSGLQASCFRFNGWGGKYELPGDREVAGQVAAFSGYAPRNHGWVLEGGSVEVDGQGTLITTRQCLLHPNRNPGMDQAALESALRDSLGAERVLWLG